MTTLSGAKGDDVVLVTGCGAGPGWEIALHLASQGLRVYATVLDEEERPALLEEAKRRGAALSVLVMDVTIPASLDEGINTIIAEAGSIFGLVNNAGVSLRGCFETLAEDEIRRVFEVNVLGTMAVTRRVLPHMRSAGRGRVVTISSVGGKIASFGLTSYCATKFAQEGFGEALALEIAPFGLQSILVEPGIVMTSRWTVNRGTARNALDPGSPYYTMFQRHEAMADRIARGSRTSPAKVAQTIYHAITTDRPRMRYVVGQPAGMMIALRRYLPGELFGRIYFGFLLRRLTEPQKSMAKRS